MTFADFKTFYDYSLIERGIQSYFVAASNGLFVKPPGETDDTRETWAPGAGEVGFFTDFEAMVFQKCRPAVAAGLRGIAPNSYQAQAIVDGNNQIRATLYRATLDLPIITGPNYAKHADLRATVAALAEEIAPMIQQGINSTVGVNPFLDYHMIVRVEDAGQNTSITPEDGYYQSLLTYNLTFAWRRDKLPS